MTTLEDITEQPFDPRLLAIVREQPHPMIFASISGAHLYGFPSPDSDYDLRGSHVLPLRQVVGLELVEETIELEEVRDGLELDLVTHDVKKFFHLLLKPNGYVLEQVFSPLVVQTSPEHAELRTIARQCITRRHVKHYQGFTESQWQLFAKEHPRRVKPLLYVFRVLLTGIHLMRTGEVEANLRTLNAGFRLPYIDGLIVRKLAGPEQATLEDGDLALYEAERIRLDRVLQEAAEASSLPDLPTGAAALSDLLVRVRLQAYGSAS
ncbi:MAG: nucleotidyltransferase domain-containing protein [Ktedonobacterales bacterium]